MKKLLYFFTLFSLLKIFGQNENIIKFTTDITNYNPLTTIKNISFIDARTDKQIGEIPFGKDKEKREIVFTNDVEQHFNKWYRIWNPSTKGDDELEFILKSLKVTLLQDENVKNRARVEYFGATFLKKNDGYHFVTKKDTIMSFTAKNSAADAVMKIIPALTTNLLRRSFKIKSWNSTFSYDDMLNFEQKIQEDNNFLKNKELKNGVYKDFESFRTQIPTPGNFSIEKNKRDEIINIIDNSKKSKIFNAIIVYAIVENGIGYLRTPNGMFYKMERNEKGYFISGTKNGVLPEENNTYSNSGLLPIAINILVKNAKDKKEKRNEILEIMIDPLTGEIDFPDENN